MNNKNYNIKFSLVYPRLFKLPFKSRYNAKIEETKGNQVRIGSGKGNHAVLKNDKTVNGYAAIYEVDNEGNQFITPIGNQNVSINQKPIYGKTPIDNRDNIMIGNSLFSIVSISDLDKIPAQSKNSLDPTASIAIAGVFFLVFAIIAFIGVGQEKKKDILRERGVKIQANILGFQKVREKRKLNEDRNQPRSYKYYIKVAFQHPYSGPVTTKTSVGQSNYIKYKANKDPKFKKMGIIADPKSDLWMRESVVNTGNFLLYLFLTAMGICVLVMIYNFLKWKKILK
jgi:hypothetical protein